jgi:hypothetical protein
MPIKPNCPEDFWKKVDKSGEHWLWTGMLDPRSGYGKFHINMKGMNSHRYCWILVNGEIPDGLVVRHKCRVKNCVNPEHLELGTTADNNADMIRDGTTMRGTKSHLSKLNEEQVLDIRRRATEGCVRLGKEFNVRPSTISEILHRRSWAWLD